MTYVMIRYPILSAYTRKRVIKCGGRKYNGALIKKMRQHIDRLVRERCNSSALAMELLECVSNGVMSFLH